MNDKAQVRPFADWLQDQRKGVLHAELGEHLAGLVTKVMDVGKPGKLTLVLRVKRQGEMVSVQDEIKVDAPQHDRPPALFFPDEEGNLTRHNPNQSELPFRQVAREEKTQ